MVASSRVRKACSRLKRALWLATFLAAVLHSGLCLQGPHGADTRHGPALSAGAGAPDSVRTSPSAGADAQDRIVEDDGQDPGRDGPPGRRHHQAILRAPSLRSAVASVVGPLAGSLPHWSCGARVLEPRRVGELPTRAAGTSLLTMVGVSRT